MQGSFTLSFTTSKKYKKKHMLFACAFALLAGVDGIGPSHNGVKVRCLTTWLYPHTVVFHHLYMHGTSLFPVFG